MKTILFIFFLFASTGLMAQVVDSAAVKINASVQARDVELIAGLLPYSEEYEDEYDAAKIKFRVPVAPTNNAIVSIDSVSVGTWLKVWHMLKKNPYAKEASADTRVEAILRAKNNTWLTAKINWYIADGAAYYNTLRNLGRDRLKGKKQ